MPDIVIAEAIPTLFHRNGTGIPTDPLRDAGMVMAMCRDIVEASSPHDKGRACSEFRQENRLVVHRQEGKDVVVDSIIEGSRWKFVISMHELDPRTSSHHDLTSPKTMKRSALTALETLRRLTCQAASPMSGDEADGMIRYAERIADEVRTRTGDADVYVRLTSPWSRMVASETDKEGDNLLDDARMDAWTTKPAMECLFTSGIQMTLTFSPIWASRHGEIDAMTALRCLRDLPPLPSTVERTAA